jgi:hypothetical protein
LILGGQHAPEWGGQHTQECHGQFKPELGGQYHRIFHPSQQSFLFHL